MAKDKIKDSNQYGTLSELTERLAGLSPEMAKAVRARVALDDHVILTGPFRLFAELAPDSAPGGDRRQEYVVLSEEATRAIAEIAMIVGATLPGDLAYLLERAIETYAANAGAAELYQAWHKLACVLEGAGHGSLLDDQTMLDGALREAERALIGNQGESGA